MTSRRKRSEELFRIAVDLPPEARAGCLDEHCASDPELRSEVERLLRLDARIEDLMPDPAGIGGDADVGSVVPPSPTRGDPESTASEIAQYTIEREIGKGGMGAVYLATDSRLGRKAAIKLVRDRFSRDERRLAMFEREARTAAHLNHPNIGTVYEFGEADGRYFIAMEYVEGRVLGDLLAEEEPIPSLQFLDIAVQIAEGLHAAHAADVVHRDLKPGNIMITDGSRVKILDFGLAKALRNAPVTTEEGGEPTEPVPVSTAYGTAGYASPEQCTGGPVDLRSDLFSLGVVLYELATGVAAFGRESRAATHEAVCNARPASPRSLNPSLSRPASELIERLMQKRPEDRPASCGEVLRVLKRIKRRAEAKHYGRRRRRRLAAAVVAGVAVPTLLAAWGLTRRPDLGVLELGVTDNLGANLELAVEFFVKLEERGGSSRADELGDRIRGELASRTGALHGQVAELVRGGDRVSNDAALDQCLEDMTGLGDLRVKLGLDPDARLAEAERWIDETEGLGQRVEEVRERCSGWLRTDDLAALQDVAAGIVELRAMRWNGDEAFPDAAVASAELTGELVQAIVSHSFVPEPFEVTDVEVIEGWRALLRSVTGDGEPDPLARFVEYARRLEDARTVESLNELWSGMDAGEWKDEAYERWEQLVAAEGMLETAKDAFSADNGKRLRGTASQWRTTVDGNPWLAGVFAARRDGGAEGWIAPPPELEIWLADAHDVEPGDRRLAETILARLVQTELGRPLDVPKRQRIDALRLELDIADCEREIRRGSLDGPRGRLEALSDRTDGSAAFGRARAGLARAGDLVSLFERVDAGLARSEADAREVRNERRPRPPRVAADGLQDLERAIDEATGRLEEELRRRGAELCLRRGDHDDALRLTEGMAGVELVRGIALYAEGDRPAARRLFETAATDETDPRPRYWLWVSSGEPNELRRALALGLDSAHAHHAASLEHLEAGDPKAALVHARKALTCPLTEDEIHARFGGYATFAEGDGIRAFDRDVRLSCANAHRRLGDYPRAGDVLVECLDRRPDDPVVTAYLDEAYASFRESLAARPPDSEGLLTLLERCWQAKHAGLDPADTAQLLERASLSSRLWQLDRAEEEANRADDGSASRLLLCAEIALARNDLSRALEVVEEAIAIELGDAKARARFLRGFVLSSQESSGKIELDRAREDLLLARDDPDLVPVSALMLANTLARLGEYERSADYADEALEAPAFPETVIAVLGGNREALVRGMDWFERTAHYLRAQSFWRLELYDDCIRACDEVTAIDREYFKAVLLRAQAKVESSRDATADWIDFIGLTTATDHGMDDVRSAAIELIENFVERTRDETDPAVLALRKKAIAVLR